MLRHVLVRLLSFSSFTIYSFFTRFVAILPSNAPGRSLKSTDCLLLSKRKTQTNGLVSHWIFFIIIFQAFVNEPLPRQAQGKDIFSSNSFLPHIIFTQFISVFEVLKIKQSVGSEWLNACWMFVILIWHSKWIFAQWPPKIENLRLYFATKLFSLSPWLQM